MSSAPSNPQIIARLQNLSRLAAAVVITVGCLVIVGWLFNIEMLKSVLPGLTTMKFNTALAFVLSGIGLLNPRRQPRIVQTAAFIVLLLGLFTLSQYLFNWNLGIDQWFVQDTATSQNTYPGRMSLVTAMNFCLVASSLLIIVRFRRFHLGQLLALAATFIALISLAGYIYNERSLYQISIFSSIALHTTVTFVTLGLGIIVAHPEHGLTAVMVTDRAGGVLTRRLLPTAIVIPLVLGWLWLKGQQAGLYDANFALALFAVSNISVFTLLIFWNAHSLNRMDAERTQALIALHGMNEQLEVRVQERTAELVEANQGLKQEITRRKEAEEALRRSETLYRTFARNFPGGVLLFGHDMRYILVDGTVINALGMSKDRMEGKTMRDIFPPQIAEASEIYWRAALAGETINREVPYGDEILALDYIPVHDEHDKVIAGMVTVQIITKRKQAELVLKESEKRFKALLESAPDAMVIVNAQGSIALVNSQTETLFGYTREELVGKPIEILIPEPFHSRHPAHRDSYIANPHMREMGMGIDLYALRRDGSQFTVEISLSPIQTAEGSLIAAAIRDVTQRKLAENALRANEEKLQAIFDLLPAGASVISTDKQIIQMNRALGKILDMNMPDLLMGKYRSRQYIHGDGTPVQPNEFPSERAIVEQQAIFDVEIGVIKEDGVTIWTSVSAAPLPDKQGAVIVTVDTTERKRSEQEMKRLQIALDRMVEGAQIIDFEWRYLYLNDAAATQGLRPKKDLLGHTMMEMYPGIDQSPLFDVLQRCMQQRVTEHIENQFTFPNNTIGWFDLSIQPIPEGIFILSTDISERKRIEEAIKNNERLLRTILEILPVGVWITDSTGAITRGNPEGQRIWAGAKYVGVEAFGEYKGWWVDTGKLIQPDDWAAARAINKGETSLNEEVEIECFDGTHKFILNSAIPMRDNQQTITGVIIVNQDITKIKNEEIAIQKMNEKLQQANEEIQRFAYIVSHDLRTPLINLKGFSELLRVSVDQIESVFESVEPLLDEAQKDTLNTVMREKIPTALRFINSSVDRMDGFTTAILKLSSLGSNQLIYSTVSLQDLVNRILQSLAAQIAGQNTQIVVDELPEIQADRTTLDQILGNIISNAINYLDPDRAGHIHIYAECDDEKTTIHVQDNGRGIAEIDYDKIFAPFRRAGHPTVEGQGMGLAYAQAMVKRHRGDIWFTSTPNVGTTFSFTIPNERV